jgi:kynurenine formamidase
VIDVPDIDPQPGDAVLFHTGWGAHWDDPDTYQSGEPGPGLELANWLVERGVALTGCDTWSYGPVPAEDPERPFEVPQFLNVRHGVFVVENLDTSELARDGVREFALILTHPKLRGASGAWTSPIALV